MIVHDKERLLRLKQIASLAKDKQFNELSKISQACNQTRQEILAIDNQDKLQCFYSPSAAIAQESYAFFLKEKRILLNQKLARQMAQFIDRRDSSKIAFGRSNVIEKIIESLPQKTNK